jgi:2-oxoglutarate ferredoxin oxidoreductase subunit gamma
MTSRIIFSGFGGQGVLLMGYVLSYGSMAKGLNVSFLPAYGSEVRGGTANCTVIVSEEEIVSPVAAEVEALVAMNPPSVDRFHNRLAKGGLLLLNSSLIKSDFSARDDLVILKVPIIELAKEIGGDRAANMVMIGALAAKSGLLNRAETIAGMKAALKGKDKSFAINEKCINQGFSYIGY